MAHFYGRIKGARGEVTRLGGIASGMKTTAASWEGAVCVSLYYDMETKSDFVRVTLQPWKGCGVFKELYNGPVNGKGKPSPKNGGTLT